MMNEKIKVLKSELLKVIEVTPLSEITNSLDGRDGIRGSSVDIDGYYCNNSEDYISVIDKDGLTLTLSIGTDDYSGNEVFENTEEYEGGMDYDDWNGEWKVTLDENSGIHLLLNLVGER